MTRGGRETGARTFNGIGIAVAFGAGDGKGAGGDEFVERSALAVGGDVDAFGLGDLQEIGSNTGQADGLRRSRTVIRGGHPLQREFIDYKEKGCTDQKANKRAHERIVAQALLHFKRGARRVALGNNVSVFALNPSFLLRRTIHRPNFSAALLRRLNVFLKGGNQRDGMAAAAILLQLSDCRRLVLTRACREWAKGSLFGVDSPGALQ